MKRAYRHTASTRSQFMEAGTHCLSDDGPRALFQGHLVPVATGGVNVPGALYHVRPSLKR